MFNYFSINNIKEQLKSSDKQIKKSLGQHYCIDKSKLLKIYEAVEKDYNHLKQLKNTYNKQIYEIGPGIGHLSHLFLENGFGLTGFEIDIKSISLFKKLLSIYNPGIKESANILHQDFTKLNNQFWEVQDNFPDIILMGNLPYNISSQILFKVFEDFSPFLYSCIFMVQKEVAERIVAKKNSKNNSILTVLSQYSAEIKIICKIPPGSFYPPPKVDSSVIYLKLKKQKEHIIDYYLFKKLVKTCFNQRRKQLSNAVQSEIFYKFDKIIILKILERFGFSSLRAENLDYLDFKNIANSYCDESGI